MEKNELSVNPQLLWAKAYHALVFSSREKIIHRKQVGLIWRYSVFLKLIIISHGSVRRTQKCISIGQGKRSKPVSDAQSMLAIANERFLDKLTERVSLEWSTMLLWIDWRIQVHEYDRLYCFPNPIRAAGGTEIYYNIHKGTAIQRSDTKRFPIYEETQS